jgi:predicted nucleic acid-binding Zn ribbon protein
LADPRRRRDRDRDVRPAASAISAFAASLQPMSLLAEVQRVWAGAVGEAVAAQAEPTGERGGVVVVSCASAVWAQELDLMAPDVVGRLNAALGGERVCGLRCQAAPPRRRSR